MPEQLSKVHVTLIAFETLKQPDGVDAFVSARRNSPFNIAKEVSTAYQTTSASSASRRMFYPIVVTHGFTQTITTS